MVRRKLPGCECPRCGTPGRVVHLRYDDRQPPVRTFKAKCDCEADGKPLRWTYPAHDLATTVVGQSPS